jgi:alpha-galactosidase
MSQTMLVNRQFALHIHNNLSFDLTQAGSPDLLATGSAVLSAGAIDRLASQPTRSTGSDPIEVITHLGAAQRLVAEATFSNTLHVTLSADAYAQWPNAFVLQWTLENIGAEPIQIDRFTAPQLELAHWPGEVWSLQGAAVNWGQDFAFPLPTNFQRDNFLGHVDRGEGGGIPIVYLWNKQHGVALMHIEPEPKDWFMPVEKRSGVVQAAFEKRHAFVLQSGQSTQSLRVIVSLHHGDFFEPLALYREVLAAQGIVSPPPTAECYEPEWCSWGYEFDVTPDEMLGVLPKTTALGLPWITLDDRWFDHYSDWNPRADTFPGGTTQMQRMVDQIHRTGGRAQIWWYPLAVEDGRGHWDGYEYGYSEILRQQPDWLILNPDGSIARNNRGLAMLCPALPEVQEHIRHTTLKFVRDWDFDGHKLDNIYTVPACHNPAHHHTRPEEATEALAEVYRLIFEITRQLKPNSVTQICPCGTPITFSLLPFTDQTVTADPTSSAQIRQRVKFYKALCGPRAAVFADHVELSDQGLDFASEIGVGGVPSTKFIWPDEPVAHARLQERWLLTPEREAQLQKWLLIYREHRLAEGEYLNLYDLAFDQPEAHAVRANGRLKFAFYAGQIDQRYHGSIVLRGLEAQAYRVHDYVNDRDLGTVQGPEATLDVEFIGALLIEAIPV